MANKEENNTNTEDVTELDLIYENSDRIDALIEILIEKKVFTEKEYETKLEKIVDENYED